MHIEWLRSISNLSVEEPKVDTTSCNKPVSNKVLFHNLAKIQPSMGWSHSIIHTTNGYTLLPCIYYDNKIQGNGFLSVTVENDLKKVKNSGLTYA